MISNPGHIPHYFNGSGDKSVFAYEVGILIDQGILGADILPAGLPFTASDLIHPSYQAMKDNGWAARILAGDLTDAEINAFTMDS
jgi:hypothetical protein